MRKVFMYLYPIKEYADMFLLYSDEANKRTMDVLNEAINERYRKKGYEVVFVLFPDRSIYGLDMYPNDSVVYVTTRFRDFSGVDENGKIKDNFTPIYPDIHNIINQFRGTQEIVVGGYHKADCVKKFAEALQYVCSDVLVDIDLTEEFFYLYRDPNYFDTHEYSKERYKEKYLNIADSREEYYYLLDRFNQEYSSSVFGFDEIKKTLR